MSCSIYNKNCFFYPFLVFSWCSFLKRITICWWSNWIHTLKAYQTCKAAQFKFMFFLRRSNLKAAMVEIQFSSLDFCHQKIVWQFGINCSINSKIVSSSLFWFLRMFLFKRDNYMLIIKLNSYTKSLLDM